MRYSTRTYPQLGTTARLSAYEGQGVGEWHLMITVDAPSLSYGQQLEHVANTLGQVRASLPASAVPVFQRIYLSDAANQAQKALQELGSQATTSVIEQPPLNGSKLGLWVWLVDNMEPAGQGRFVHNGYSHLFTASQTLSEADSESATIAMLRGLSNGLRQHGGSLADNCVRTWLFVRDIDRNYQGVVTGRNKVFQGEGLTAATHFIASTGIEGRSPDHHALVSMDSYSVLGLQPSQMGYLYAKEHLSPTYDYGVAFERGTYIDYGDRRHVFISGTASINNKGEIMHPGNLSEQAARMLSNVEALLCEAHCGWSDVGQMTVYLRDMADYAAAKQIFEARFPDIPFIIVLAPVCRPGWLIEVECMAVRAAINQKYKEL